MEGSLGNTIYKKNWYKKFSDLKLENSIGWELAIIKKINKFEVDIETESKQNGKIEYKDISWTKKEFNEILNEGDIVYVQKDEENFSLRQLPLANGSIVVIHPFTGRVLAMTGGFSFKKSEFNRLLKHFDNLDQHLNLLFTH